MAGDPMTSRKWCRRSTYTLSEALETEGIVICASSVAAVLRHGDYSLRCNRKSIAETHHPDRNRQFEIIAETKKLFEDLGAPIICVDSKKKELIGNFRNAGKKWGKTPEEVLNHEFRSEGIGMANPYGIYEPLTNQGTIIVGTSHDTAEFAVDSIEMWLNSYGWQHYGTIKQMLLLCDSGGSNSARARLWKYKLHEKISKPYGITIRVCHYPSGASKWNPVDHRLFSYITLNWQGEPLRSYETILGCIRSTKTKTGLRVQAQLNEKRYDTGITITDDQMLDIALTPHDTLPLWNYTMTGS